MSTDTRVASPPAVERAAAQSFLVLRVGFTVLPIVFGLDKFTDLLVDWRQYLAPWIVAIAPFGPSTIMHVVGVVEVVAGVLVALKPRYGAPVVAVWLAGIVLTLVTGGGWFDVALRDVGLLLAALTLARLAAVFDPPGLTVSRFTGGRR
jgi:uncharacterized membrane protein YphA (DoxX/SURF4 family)